MTTRTKWMIGIIGFLLGVFLLLFTGDVEDTLQGLFFIWTHPSVLVTDYLYVGGLYASLLNMWILVFVSISLLGLTKTKLNGLHIAGLFTIAGLPSSEKHYSMLYRSGLAFIYMDDFIKNLKEVYLAHITLERRLDRLLASCGLQPPSDWYIKLY